ncbi:MAG: hypothetical protein U5J78_04760 [Parasphingorhabdus sp.]|nr:hypothetical protein [Parasphingorhabdus sp.]
MLILMLVAFIGGVIATGWVVSRYNPFENKPVVEKLSSEPSPSERLANRIDADGKVLPPKITDPAGAPATVTNTPARELALAARVADLEDRLSRINVQAQAASGNAARAEGLLIAFAARRALDRGSPLGYIEGQLRLRFGDAQPKAVTTIINASREPVTLEELASLLEDMGPALTTGARNRGFWESVQAEFADLFVVRKDGTPSPAPQQRLTRAKRYVEVGNVEAAIGELEKLPGSEGATAWMEKARRYNEARRALDVIETAAILEPQQLRGSEGELIEQPSPLAAPPIAAPPIAAPPSRL